MTADQIFATSTTNPEGADLLDAVRNALSTYVVLPDPEAYTAVTLWIAATHAQPAWQSAPRLAINSPEKRCGKSRLLDVVEAVSFKPLMAFSATVAALFRSIEESNPPTLIFDEADAIWSKKKANDGAEDLRALINAGFGRGRPAIRCVGPQQTPTEFATFAMAALAGIGDCLPDTVLDRAVRITMRRRAPGEKVAQFRHRRDAVPLHGLRGELSKWLSASIDELSEAQPEMPVEDRAADTWEPLVAVADLAGGSWPSLARNAAVRLCTDAADGDSDASLGVRLLADIRDIFSEAQKAALGSEDLVLRLQDVKEAPWRAFALSQRDLSYRLRNFNVKPDRVRPDGTTQIRGYRLADFTDAFARYLPAPPSQPVFASHAQVSPVTDQMLVTGASVTSQKSVTAENRLEQHQRSIRDAVTVRDAPPGGQWECVVCGRELINKTPGRTTCTPCTELAKVAS